MTSAEQLIFRTHIDATAEAVWHELTRTDQAHAAGYNMLFVVDELSAGRPFQMRSPSGRMVNVVGTIVEAVPPRRLEQAMRYTAFDEPFTARWDIHDANGGGVDVTLTVSGLAADSKTLRDLNGSGGGTWILTTLKQVAEDGRASLGTRLMYAVSVLIERFRVPDGTEPERWPWPPDD